jgi:virginiamycin B lyase
MNLRTSQRVFPLALLALLLSLLASAVHAARLGQLRQFRLPFAAQPHDIALGPDGNLWFTAWGAGRPFIGRVTPRGTTTQFPLPSERQLWEDAITAGPDGALWFTQFRTGRIGRINTEGGITEFLPPGAPQVTIAPNDIAAGPDGNLWFTDSDGDYQTPTRVWRLTPTGDFTPFTVPAGAGQITAGPDGAVWFTADFAIVRMTTAGAITQFAVPADPNNITLGPDGALWFTAREELRLKVGRITTDGTITMFPGPRRLGRTHFAAPASITAGSDGNLWFTDYYSETVNRMTPSGKLTQALRVHRGIPLGIAAGPDDTVWFTVSGWIARNDRIGVLRLRPTRPGR